MHTCYFPEDTIYTILRYDLHQLLKFNQGDQDRFQENCQSVWSPPERPSFELEYSDSPATNLRWINSRIQKMNKVHATIQELARYKYVHTYTHK